MPDGGIGRIWDIAPAPKCITRRSTGLQCRRGFFGKIGPLRVAALGPVSLVLAGNNMDDLGIAFKLNDQVITFWQFYIAWTAGVVGWVFSREAAWPFQKRIGIGMAVLIFNVFNISGLYKTSSSLSTVISAMSMETYKAPQGVTEQVFQAAIQRLSTGDWYLHIGPHIVGDLIVLYFIFVVAKKNPAANNAN